MTLNDASFEFKLFVVLRRFGNQFGKADDILFVICHGRVADELIVELCKFRIGKCQFQQRILDDAIGGTMRADVAAQVRVFFDRHALEITQEDRIDSLEFSLELIDDVALPATLEAAGVDEGSLEMLAEDAMLQQRLLVNNPRDVAYEDALAIYRAAYRGLV